LRLRKHFCCPEDAIATPPAPDLEPLVTASRVITAAVVASLADADSDVTVPGLRVLVVLDAHGPLNLSAVADVLGVNPSNASRACDRLADSGLLERSANAEDRRQVSLSLTPAGRTLLDRLMDRRREILRAVVEEMSAADRERLMSGLRAFNAVAEAASGPEADVSQLELVRRLG
jgi:DNA-binding MarR family transcriptional regulator